MANRTFSNVKINVAFTQHANHTDNLVTNESLAISLGKIMKWKNDFHSVVWTGAADSASNATTVNGHTVNIDVPANAKFTDTTYTFATGDTNGTFKVTPLGGTAQNVSIKGLGSMAYKTDTDYIPTSKMGVANGVATLGTDGKVPTSQLPSYVDDVTDAYRDASTGKFYTSSAKTTEITPEGDKIYVDTATNTTWRWTGTAYVQIKGDLTLGETSSTAYRGDRGKIAYDHSQLTSGNPHNVTAADVGLGNVENKSVSTIKNEILTKTNVNNLYTSDGGLVTFNDKASDTKDGILTKEYFSKIGYTNIAYATSATAAATAAKVATVVDNDNWELKTGSIVCIKFSATNTGQNPTINVNDTGAFRVWYNTALLTTSNLGYAGTTNRPMWFMYDGTQWVFMGWSMDNSGSDTYDRTRLSAAPKAGTAGVFQYSIIALDTDDKFQALTTTGGTGTSKVWNTSAKFRNAPIIFYYGGAAKTNNTALETSNLFSEMSGLDLRYSSNITSSAGFTANMPIYIECDVNDAGYWSVTTTGLTQTFTSGKYYIFLGIMNNVYQCSIASDHPIYYYDGTNLVPTGGMTAAEKTKLAGIEANANKYTHPTYTAHASGLYKITVDTTGHISAATGVAASDVLGAIGTKLVKNVTQKSSGVATITYTDDTTSDVTIYTHPITAGNKHIPPGGASGQFLKYFESGTATWAAISTSDISGYVAPTTYVDFTGATASANGVHGLVPAPTKGDQATKFLKADGTWSDDPVIEADTLTLNVVAS